MTYDLDKFRAFFAQDKYAMLTGVVIESVSDECVTCSLEITASHMNAGGGVQGGAIFTLCDLAFAVHCNLALVNGDEVGITVGQSCGISFLKSPKGKRLTASSVCLSKGRSISVFRVCVTDETGAAIAEMHGNAYTTPKLQNKSLRETDSF
jgi:acyl-CoA thioesterase